MEVLLGEMKPPKVDWCAELERWEKTGLSAAAYCRERGLTYSTFGYYKRKKETAVRPQLVALGEFGRADHQALRPSGVAVRMDGSCCAVAVTRDFDEPTLLRVLAIVGQAR